MEEEVVLCSSHECFYNCLIEDVRQLVLLLEQAGNIVAGLTLSLSLHVLGNGGRPRSWASGMFPQSC